MSVTADKVDDEDNITDDNVALQEELGKQPDMTDNPSSLNDEEADKIIDEKSQSGTSTTEDTSQLDKDSDLSSVDPAILEEDEEEEEEEEVETPSEDSLLDIPPKANYNESSDLTHLHVAEPIASPVPVSNGVSEGILGLPLQASLLHSESLKCSAPGCRHQAQNQGGLILHLHSHFKFEIATLGTTGETKFCYVLGKYQCLLCPLETPHRVVFGEHVRHHLLNHPYNCGHCSEGVESVAQLRQHNRQTHRLLLAKLVVNDSEHVDAIMNRLGPQAPRIEKDVALPKSTLDKTPPKTDKSPGLRISESGASSIDKKEGHPIDCTTLINADDGKISNIKEEVSAAAAPTMKQNFKYLLTNSAKFCCSECRYTSGDVPAFTVHIFNDIHRALRNVCGDCNQKGINNTDFTPCPIVEQIIRALIKQKDQLIGGQVASNAKKKSSEDASSLEKTEPENSIVDLHVSSCNDANNVPSSPFEETMALLKDLASPRSDAQNNFGQSRDSTDTYSEMEKNCTNTTDNIKESVISVKTEVNGSSKNIMSDKAVKLTEAKFANDCDNQSDKSRSPSSLSNQKDTAKRSMKDLEEELLSRLEKEQGKSGIDPTKANLKCGVIDCAFTTKDDVCFKLHHLVKHPGRLQLSCSVCRKIFENVDKLLSHIMEEHKQDSATSATVLPHPPRAPEKSSPIFPCVIAGCEISFNRVPELNNHFDQRHPDLGTSMPCCFCYLIFKTRAEFAGHVQCHIKNIMKCSYCSDEYDSKGELLAHIASGHEGMPKRINICIKILNNERLSPSGPSSGSTGKSVPSGVRVKTEDNYEKVEKPSGGGNGSETSPSGVFTLVSFRDLTQPESGSNKQSERILGNHESSRTRSSPDLKYCSLHQF